METRYDEENGPYSRLPTAPTAVTVESGPDLSDAGPIAGDPSWEPSTGTGPIVVDEARLAPWALFAAVVALVASFFVGWGIPVGMIAAIAAIMSLRRPRESRETSVWALVLSLVACVYSVGWLVWSAYGFGFFG